MAILQQHTFPVTHAILSADALATELLPRYDLGTPVRTCRFHMAGINDTYQIRTQAGDRYFLRAYRTRWRSIPDVRYELDALNHLRAKGTPVAYPATARDGSQLQTVAAPEGPRIIVVFALAEGDDPSYDEAPEEKAHLYGRAVARLHNGLDDFSSRHNRFQIDLEHLLEAPLRHIAPFLAHRPADWAYLQQFTNVLRSRIAELPVESLERGFCHGDLQGYHHHITPDGTMTFFDFDCCGFGIRAYDIAVFRWCARLSDLEGVWWPPYLTGYRSLRPLAELDLQAIPLFVCARYIWHMGLHTANAYDWGHAWYGDRYFDERLQNLPKLAADYGFGDALSRTLM